MFEFGASHSGIPFKRNRRTKHCWAAATNLSEMNKCLSLVHLTSTVGYDQAIQMSQLLGSSTLLDS